MNQVQKLVNPKNSLIETLSLMNQYENDSQNSIEVKNFIRTKINPLKEM